MHKNLMGKLIKSNNVNRLKYAHVYGADEVRATDQPHVRIEFDDIRDVPKVWVDGELIARVNDKFLISIMVYWNTDTENQNHKGFDINYFDMTDKRGQSKGLREATVI
ncbi:hypothetical protein [Weissella confusa]|uniref:hypothetical protein n=1 Tax=Weissella confusa TaxID=1583 RepID=UPI0022247BDC|nr:hypothetical protein [Weissella confusa]UYY89820.1 hypothetical protein OLB07_08650 [Weissella confusa]